MTRRREIHLGSPAGQDRFPRNREFGRLSQREPPRFPQRFVLSSSQACLRRLESRPSTPSRRQDRRPQTQPPDGSSARLLCAAARGNAPTRPGRPSRLRHTQVPGAVIGCPSVSDHRVGTATRQYPSREPEALKSPPPTGCSRLYPPSHFASSIAR